MPSVSDGCFLLNWYEREDAGVPARRWWALALAAVALMIVLRLLLIAVPLERDEGGYAYIADQWRQGQAPYVHALETKPPGVFAAYALILQFGRSVEAIRLAGLAVALLTALLLWRFVRRAYGARVAGLAVAVTTLLMVAPRYLGFTLNAEMVMMPFILGAFLCLPFGRASRGWWSYLLCGVLLGAAVLIKPVALTEALPIAFVIAVGEGSWRTKCARGIAAGVGFVAVIGLCVALFAWWGAAREMVFWAFTYNLQYSTDLSAAARIQTLLYRVVFRGLLLRDWAIWLAAGVGAVGLARSRAPLARLFPLVWMLSSFVGVSASGRWTGHYFQQCLPAVGLLAAIGVSRIIDAIDARHVNLASKWAAIGMILMLVTIYPIVLDARSYLAGPQLARLVYGLNPFMEGEAVGHYLAAHTTPDETVFVFGTEGEFLFHARRRSATRFVFTYPLGGTHPRALEWQRQALAEVQRNNPRYIVAVNIGPSFYLNERAPKFLQNETVKMIAAQYVREAAVIVVGERQTKFMTETLPPPDQTPALVEIFRRR
jgi:4-amino-4-deoxy-L-arabinose transferase-like glycosyltransferase